MSASQESVTEQVTASKKPATEVENVSMTDGREVPFAGKRKLIKDVTVDDEAKTASVRFDFRNGETRTFAVNGPLLLRFAAHGASQKIGDETAGETDVDDMVMAVDDIIKRLSAGEWGAERKAGGGFAGAGLVVRAVSDVTGKSIDEVKTWIEEKLAALGCTRQALYASLKNPKSAVGQRYSELELEKKSKEAKYNADDLMSELTGG